MQFILKQIENGNLEEIKRKISSFSKNRINFFSRAACYYGQLEILKYLYSIGADILAMENLALRWACVNKHSDIVKFLLKKGADLKVRNNIPIKSAKHNGDLETIYILIKNGADKNILSERQKRYVILRKYYSKWRIIVFKNWFRKVLIPLYYSPKFFGGEKEKKSLTEGFQKLI